jgi:hypothetical protein
LKATVVPIDSEVLGGNVLAIEEFDPAADFARFEQDYLKAHRPVYVSCKVPLERIAHVHCLERQGFSLIECQIRSSINLKAPFQVPAFPYAFARVKTGAELESVLAIAATAFEHDRFSVDPLVPRHASGERYRRYVERSYASPDEAVYRLYDPLGGATVAFKTHRYLPRGEVLLLLGGVHRDYGRLGLGVINTHAELGELRRLGMRSGFTHISAANYQVFNLEVGRLGFRVVTTFAVMRKIYAAAVAPG